MTGAVDWTALAERLGTITWTEGGRSELGGTRVARKALAELLGEELLVSAVEHYLRHEPGDETARSVLLELKPPTAMDRCLAVFESDPDIDRVRTAVELLRWVADQRALAWYPSIMAHEDEIVRAWGTRLIDQLWMSGELEAEDAMPYLMSALSDGSEIVRSNAEQVVEMLEQDMALDQERAGPDA